MEWSELAAAATGYLALGLIAAAGAVPLAYRLREGRRAAPQSRPISAHVVLGVATVSAAFLHGLAALLSLGSARAIHAGDLGLALGAAALLVIMAHVGIGLQLRDPKLKKRAEKRRAHQITAAAITILALLHLVSLVTA